jgi:transcriptional regulator with XRE-family HTH domain
MTNLSVAEMGRLIRAQREKLNLTQGAVALAVGTTQQTIEKIELGKVERSSYLLPILQFLGIKIDQDHTDRVKVNQRAAVDRRDADLDTTSNEFDGPRSLLPTGLCPQPYFVTGEKKGLYFQYFIARPRPGPARAARCSIFVAGDWVRGAPIGSRLDIVDRQDSRNRFPNLPTWVVAIADANKPEEISEMAVGVLHEIRGGQYHLTEVWSNREFQLPENMWQIAELDQITLNQPPDV